MTEEDYEKILKDDYWLTAEEAMENPEFYEELGMTPKEGNLTDEQIEIIKNRGGLIGLNFCKDFFEVDNKSGIDSLKVHLDYLLEKGCEDVISFGTDFDGCELSDGIIGVESIEEIYNSLLNSGYKEELLKNLFYNNANLFFKNMIQ